MDLLEQYYKLVDIKPEYYILEQPWLRPTQKRFQFNIKQFETWIDREAELLLLEPPTSKKKKKGGASEPQITYLIFDG